MTAHPKRPLIGVGVVVLRDDRVALIRRAKPPRVGGWSLPGGRQRLGETVRETAAREVREECGLEVEVTALLDVVDSMIRGDGDSLLYHYTLIDFLAEWRAGDLTAGGDAGEVVWADPNELSSFGLWRETERIIALALEQRG